MATAIVLFIPLLVTLSQARSAPVETGIASIYRPWKKSRWVPYARYPGNWSVKPTPCDLVCAHRTLPFWTILRLTRRNGAVAHCVVLDRGPFGFCERTGTTKIGRGCKRGERWVVAVRRKGRKGRYRGVIDATPAVHKMMRSNGWVTVKVERLVGLARTRRVLRQTVGVAK